jgi:protein-tyrosine phosphatase
MSIDIHPEIAARRVPLEGSWNFRDLGGYETVDGRTIKWRTVYRADGLQGLTASDHATIVVELGIRVIYDFQRQGEVDQPVPLYLRGDAPRRVHLPIGGQVSTNNSFHEQVLSGEIDRIEPKWMTEMYCRFSRVHAPEYATMLRGLSEADDLPAVFHCAAGNDRTGIGAALLLAALGVPDETIVSDYSLTEHARLPFIAELRDRLAEQGVDIDNLRGYFGAAPECMRDTLADLRAEYGSLEGFLTDHVGVDMVTITRLRSLLLDT